MGGLQQRRLQGAWVALCPRRGAGLGCVDYLPTISRGLQTLLNVPPWSRVTHELQVKNSVTKGTALHVCPQGEELLTPAPVGTRRLCAQFVQEQHCLRFVGEKEFRERSKLEIKTKSPRCSILPGMS